MSETFFGKLELRLRGKTLTVLDCPRDRSRCDAPDYLGFYMCELADVASKEGRQIHEAREARRSSEGRSS